MKQTDTDSTNLEPTKRILRTRDVLALVGIARSTLWREVRAGRFPKPIELSLGRKGFLREDVEAWLAAKRAQVE